MIAEKFGNEARYELQRLCETLPKAEKNLDSGMRRTLRMP